MMHSGVVDSQRSAAKSSFVESPEESQSAAFPARAESRSLISVASLAIKRKKHILCTGARARRVAPRERERVLVAVGREHAARAEPRRDDRHETAARAELDHARAGDRSSRLWLAQKTRQHLRALPHTRACAQRTPTH